MSAREQYKLACRIARVANYDLLMMHRAFVRRGLSPEKLIIPAHHAYWRTSALYSLLWSAS